MLNTGSELPPPVLLYNNNSDAETKEDLAKALNRPAC